MDKGPDNINCHIIIGLLKEMSKFICAAIYALFLPIFHRKPRCLIIYYHNVEREQTQIFEKQIIHLLRNYNVVKPSKIKNAITNGNGVSVGITFDDAFLGVFENAVPILKRYGLTAGICVPTGFVGGKSTWTVHQNQPCKNEILMSKADIVALDKDGFDIFSHTVSHYELTNLDDETLEKEMTKSKQELEELLGHKVVGISYPHGAYDTRVCKAARKAGYKLGFTIEPRMIDSTTDNLKIGRFSVSPRDNMTKFKLKVSGAYQAVRFLRVLKTLVVKFIGR